MSHLKTSLRILEYTIDYGDSEDVNRCAGRVERLLWIVAACEMPFEGLHRLRNVIRGTTSGMPFKGTTVFRPLPVRLLTPSPSCMRFLFAYTVVRDRQGLQSYLMSVPHEEVKKLLLDCLSAE